MYFFTKHLNVWSFQLLAAWRFRPQPLSLSPFAWAVGSCRPAACSQPGWSSQNLSGTNQWGFNDKDQGFNCPMIKHWKIRKFNDPSSNINDKDQCYDSHINCPANIMWETYNDCANISWIRQPKTRMMKVGAMGPGQSIYIYTYILYTQQNGKIIASRTRFMDLDVQIKRLGTVPNKLDRN